MSEYLFSSLTSCWGTLVPVANFIPAEGPVSYGPYLVRVVDTLSFRSTRILNSMHGRLSVIRNNKFCYIFLEKGSAA